MKLPGTNRFVPNACSNVATHLPALVVGQNNAIDHLVTVVCEHLRDNAQIDAERSSTMLPQGSPTAFGAGKAAGGNEYELRRRKPLFISVHGPPGTGKTFTHTLLAKALYNRDLATAKSCPGEGCAGAKVLYGITYTAEERSGQLAMVREAILDHLRSTPQALLVIEEYDKLDCASRSMLRQLVQHPEIVNLDLSHSIIMLESNLGFLQLANLLREANGDKSQIPPEAADRILRNVSLTAWRAANCEGIGDTVAFAATVDHYVAFYPLTRGEVEVLLERELSFNYARRAARLGGTLVWEPAAVRWLADRVDYDNNNFPLEGASQVSARLKHLMLKTKDAAGEVAVSSTEDGVSVAFAHKDEDRQQYLISKGVHELFAELIQQGADSRDTDDETQHDKQQGRATSEPTVGRGAA
ncbi:hypothetical protein VOLCADRAFT_89984 [Volvox carteri f. nagariensis]|uniref:ORC1/DEAH AAA+ ATPase domain-containing protein n=1 Tax=Volvox carteri f. nagariensis TaxID=3068 RepID=D8TT65_VOLCA|nr:uncharacterized protein VOLCADRAFT_89984 [Volvox carteri f. nagariensis]EFJ49257.1 hypothetical protein VOLCADRAFT_89984 [Volvox carteri f. nagariensis]|eukprot:XP_002949705.1 hypothetical protein VOLCADRAFT_89984 [Volvox carteri f. nagariensis]